MRTIGNDQSGYRSRKGKTLVGRGNISKVISREREDWQVIGWERKGKNGWKVKGEGIEEREQT
jgi:ABC-type tungstate transport system permease subunit